LDSQKEAELQGTLARERQQANIDARAEGSRESVKKHIAAE
jgi:DNA-binding CsgD family transcriptional regulator